jgi:hypothetical protein
MHVLVQKTAPVRCPAAAFHGVVEHAIKWSREPSNRRCRLADFQ